MQLPNTRTILIGLGGFLLVAAAVALVVSRTRRPSPSQPIARSTAPSSLIADQASTVPPVVIGGRLFFADGLRLSMYRFKDRSFSPIDVPSSSGDRIVSIIPSPKNERLVILQLERGTTREYVLFDIIESKVLTKFGDRVLGVTWVPDSELLVIFGKSTQGTFFFSTSSADGKDQKTIGQVEEERAQPLALTKQNLIFTATDSNGQTRLKALNRTSGANSVLVEDVGRLSVSEDSSYIVFNATDGLYALTTADLTQNRVAEIEIDRLLNWSGDKLIYGHSETGLLTIDSWDATNGQTATVTVLPAGTTSFPKAAFVDEINKELIYWTDKQLTTEPF